jgi:hypothetical protein
MVVMLGGSMEKVLPIVFTNAITIFLTIMITVFRVRWCHILEPDLGCLFNPSQLSALIVSVESKTNTRSTCATCPAGSVNVGLDVLWWFQLHHQVNLRDVEAARSYVRSYDTSNSTLLEVFKDVFTPALWNVAV